MKIIIYATHTFGTFSDLSKNPDIIVLGYGTKWKGFIEKTRVIKDYLDTLPDNEIVTILDGFDSYIKYTTGVEDKFKSLDCDVLYSADNMAGGQTMRFVPSFIMLYITRKIFSSCKDNVTANSGMCMGYVKSLKTIFQETINGDSDDDQRNLNKICSKFSNLKVDAQRIIFENCETLAQVKKSKAAFCSIPGTVSFFRIGRGIIDYTKYLIPEILTILLILFFIYKIIGNKYGIRKKNS